jgi:hypothetical protein
LGGYEGFVWPGSCYCWNHYMNEIIIATVTKINRPPAASHNSIVSPRSTDILP